MYSVDRRALLNPTKNKDDNDEDKYNEDEKKDSTKQTNKSVFVIGSKEHRYYKMLQIQNEMESIMFNKNTESSSDEKLKELNAEMKKLMDEEEKSM